MAALPAIRRFRAEPKSPAQATLASCSKLFSGARLGNNFHNLTGTWLKQRLDTPAPLSENAAIKQCVSRGHHNWVGVVSFFKPQATIV